MIQMIAANWKMYKNSTEARSMLTELATILKDTCPSNREIIIFPSFTALEAAYEVSQNIHGFAIGAQDIYPATEGAFTGAISPKMVRDCGSTWVLTGHSERRHIMGENNDMVHKKTAFALESSLRVIACIGETLDEREKGKLKNILTTQLESIFTGIPTDKVSSMVIAYEPVWAIGTGKTANTDDIIEAHAIIRELLQKILGDKGTNVRILYGGSVKPENASEILTLTNVNGLLVGGASLKADSFAKIITA